ncbi:MAG: hypothetical protein JO297_10295 [Nitrososphaeraceae archaeon]|nr:hypothetical protein [Nitrososphaeraceae archaeon]
MIKYVICAIIYFSFLIQTATAAATDPDYNFGFTAGTQANTTYNSQQICSGKSYGCIMGFYDGFQQSSHKQQIAAGLTEYNTGYDQGYKDGIANANTGDDITTDEIPDICAHITQQWCAGWQAGYKAGFWSVPNTSSR